MDNELEILHHKLCYIIEMLEEHDLRFSNIENAISKITGTEISERLMESWNIVSGGESRLRESYQKFYETIEDNNKRFSSMVNEFNGLVSIERSDFIAKKKFIIEMLEKLGR